MVKNIKKQKEITIYVYTSPFSKRKQKQLLVYAIAIDIQKYLISKLNNLRLINYVTVTKLIDLNFITEHKLTFNFSTY